MDCGVGGGRFGCGVDVLPGQPAQGGGVAVGVEGPIANPRGGGGGDQRAVSALVAPRAAGVRVLADGTLFGVSNTSTSAGGDGYNAAGVTALLYIDRRMRAEGLDVSLAAAAASPRR